MTSALELTLVMHDVVCQTKIAGAKGAMSGGIDLKARAATLC